MYGNLIKNVHGIENLTGLKIIYLDQNQTQPFQNITNLRLSEKRKKFYETLFINLIDTNLFDIKNCEITIYYSKRNIHYNLFSHEQIDFVLKYCLLS